MVPSMPLKKVTRRVSEGLEFLVSAEIRPSLTLRVTRCRVLQQARRVSRVTISVLSIASVLFCTLLTGCRPAQSPATAINTTSANPAANEKTPAALAAIQRAETERVLQAVRLGLKKERIWDRREAVGLLAPLVPKNEPAINFLIKLLRKHKEPAVPSLIPYLKEGRTERIYAAYALGGIGRGAKSAIPALLANTTGDDYGHFTTAMAEMGEVIHPFIVEELESGEPTRQQRATHILMSMKNRGAFAIPQLKKTIKSPDRDVRQSTIDAISRMTKHAEPCRGELEIAMGDPHQWIQYLAAYTLVQINIDHKGATDKLIALLADKEMAPHAMSGLWIVGERGKAAKNQLEKIEAESETSYDRLRAASVLLSVLPESKIALAPLRNGLEDENYEIRGSAASYCGYAGKAAAPLLEDLKQLKEDKNYSVQSWATDAIRKIEAALNPNDGPDG
jgi:HEAT repeat protein